MRLKAFLTSSQYLYFIILVQAIIVCFLGYLSSLLFSLLALLNISLASQTSVTTRIIFLKNHLQNAATLLKILQLRIKSKHTMSWPHMSWALPASLIMLPLPSPPLLSLSLWAFFLYVSWAHRIHCLLGFFFPVVFCSLDCTISTWLVLELHFPESPSLCGCRL